jgi:hypothetical protein
MPTTRSAMNRPENSLTLPDSNTWRCEISWVMNAYCVNRMPSTAAISSVYQVSCSITRPYQAPTIATVITEKVIA